MREGTRGSTGKSSELLWETLEQTIRGKVQEFIQEILEEEVTDFLGGRRKSQRKSSAEGDPKGYRNGYGKPRNLTLASGTVEVRRPRVRDVEERFESRVLPLFERRTKESAELLWSTVLAEGATGVVWACGTDWLFRSALEVHSKDRRIDFGASGSPSTRSGSAARWRAGRSSTPGPTGST